MVSNPTTHDAGCGSLRSTGRVAVWLALGGAAALGVGLFLFAVFFASFSRPSLPGDPREESGEAAVVLPPIVPRSPEERWHEWDDPQRDGWNTEAFHDRAKPRLVELIGALLAEKEASGLEEFLAADFSTAALVPASLETPRSDGLFEVERAPRSAGDASSRRARPARAFRGVDGLIEAFAPLLRSFSNLEETRFEAKIVRVEQRGKDAWETASLVAFTGPIEDGALEAHASWKVEWLDAPGSPPRVQRIDVESFERTRRRTPRPILEDVTESVLGSEPSWKSQLLRGHNHWVERIQDNRFFALFGTPGIAVGDLDGDGLDDLYLGQEGGIPNRLYLQRPDGSMRDASAESGADWLESTRGVLIADFDNDGRRDLALAIYRALVVAKNDGGARFSIATVLPTGSDTMSLAAADIDGDADLDIYVASYREDDLSEDTGPVSIRISSHFVYHDANDGAPNRLFRNETARGGAIQFSDATSELGLDENNRRYSFACAFEDFDDDGDQDLYIANDFGRNSLYRADRDASGRVRFHDVAAETGTEDSASGMSVSWGDPNRDGRMDLYVGNMFSSAGGRVTYQGQFKPNADPEVRERLQRFARGNTLLVNRGTSFEDASADAGVTMGRWAWSSNFVDLDVDGWEDIVVANGYITTDDTGDL